MSSMEHQEVNLGQQQNQDLVWDLDSIARRELAERFMKLFENRLCVYSESTRQLYTNYDLHFPTDYGRKMVVLPNPYAFHDTLHGIDPAAVRKTGLCVLPAIREDLGGGLAGQQWVVNAYLLMLGSLILIGGSLGDVYGEKRVFFTGIAGFGAVSVVCAAAPTIEVLVGARALQGVFGALLTPASLAIIVAAFPEDERGR